MGWKCGDLHLIRLHRLRCRRNWPKPTALNTRREFIHRGEFDFFDRFRGPGALQAEAPVFLIEVGHNRSKMRSERSGHRSWASLSHSGLSFLGSFGLAAISASSQASHCDSLLAFVSMRFGLALSPVVTTRIDCTRGLIWPCRTSMAARHRTM
jgi:hypothetical protein